MRKNLLLVVIFVLAIIAPTSAFASNSVQTSNDKEVEKFIEKYGEAINEANTDLLSIYQASKNDSDEQQKIKDFYEKKEIKELLHKVRREFNDNPELETKYIENVDAFDLRKVAEKLPINSLKLNSAEKKIVTMEDGSFTQVTEEFGKVNSNELLMSASSQEFDAYRYIRYDDDDYYHRWTYTIVHLFYPDTKLALMSYMSATIGKLTISNATTTGTFSQVPIVSVSSSASVIRSSGSSSTAAKTSGSYQVTFAGMNGVGLHVENYDLNASYRLDVSDRYGAFLDTTLTVVQ
ncbi:hypothetical protein [Marinicrinis sediminis]|uniref:Uncharacterized protein n=1 Tax=Marinicrinis sediminis TaxID=1652465 RepID=A0ABW5RAM8_9BACL